MTSPDRKAEPVDMTRTGALSILEELAKIGVDVLAEKARGTERSTSRTATEELPSLDSPDEHPGVETTPPVSQVTVAKREVPTKDMVRARLGLPTTNRPVLSPRPVTVPRPFDAVRTFFANKRALVGVGVGALILSTGTVGGMFFGQSTSGENAQRSPEAGRTGTTPESSKVSVGGINLATSLSATDLIGKEPFAILGYQGTGEMEIIYKGNDNKKHVIKEYKGDTLNWALSQAVKYYSLPRDLGQNPLSFEQKQDRTIIKIDLSKMAFDIDPTMKNDTVGEDGTKQNFVFPLYAKGAQVVPPDGVDPLDAATINNLITEPVNVDAAVAKAATPEEWMSLPQKDRIVGAGKPTGFLVAQAAILTQFEAGKCGDDNLMTEAQKVFITAQLHTALQHLGVDVSTIEFEFSGHTNNDALERVVQSKKYGASYGAADIVSNNLMRPVEVSATCTVTQTNPEG